MQSVEWKEKRKMDREKEIGSNIKKKIRKGVKNDMAAHVKNRFLCWN